MVIIFFNRSGKLILVRFSHEDDLQSLIHNKFAIALVNNYSVTVGHIPKFISKLTNFFLKHGGHIKCKIDGGKKYSKYLEQGWLEVPTRLTISNRNKKNDRCHERKTEPPR